MSEESLDADSISTEVADAPVADQSVDSGAETASQEPSDTQNPDHSQFDSGAEEPSVPQPKEEPVQQEPPEVAVWQKRYKDTQAWATNQAQRATELERQWDGLDPQRVRQILDEHERQQTQ